MKQAEQTLEHPDGSAPIRHVGAVQPAFDPGSRMTDALFNQEYASENARIMTESSLLLHGGSPARVIAGGHQVTDAGTDAEWVIVCWDRPGCTRQRDMHQAAQKAYIRDNAGRVRSYGHLVDERPHGHTIATTYFIRFDHREAAEDFVDAEPLYEAGVYEKVEIHRWARRGGARSPAPVDSGRLMYFLIGASQADAHHLFQRHRSACENYCRAYDDQFVLRGALCSDDGLRSTGTALVIEVPSWLAMQDFWKNEPVNSNGGYRSDTRIRRWVPGL